MLRKLFFSSLLAVSVVVSVAAQATTLAAQQAEDEHIMPVSDDRWVPWPMHLAQPFPWNDIQGLWKAEQGEYSSYFALKIVRQKSTGHRQLQVKQFDGDTCRVLATGVGLERNEKVFAQMTSKGGVTYRVQLTAFNKKDAPLPPLRGLIPTDSVMLLSIGTLEPKAETDMFHMQIMKVSAFLTQKVCIEDVKK